MRLLHTSDWHLGASDGARSLLEDQYFFVDDICRIAAENKVDAVLLAGDVYDRSVASAEAIKLYDYAMSKICLEMRIPVLTIAGNHDSAERLSSCRDLLAGAGLHIVGDLEKEPCVVELGDTDVYLLPWITEEKVKGVFPEAKAEIKGIEDAYRVVLDKLRASFAPGKKHILVSHAFITDTPTSTSDRAAEIGTATQVSAELFEGFDYVALGHLHAPHDVNSFIRYSGTPMPYSFGKEEKQTKSVTLIDTADMSRVEVPVKLLHKRTTLTGTLEELLHPTAEADVANGFVNAAVSDCVIGAETLSMLRGVYPNLLDWHGKNYSGSEGSTSMSLEEFEQLADKPEEIFRRFCIDRLKREPDEHQIELFAKAVKEVNNETVIS